MQNLGQGHRVIVPASEECLEEITMQVLTLAAITTSGKCTLWLDSTLNLAKVNGERNLGQRHWVIVNA